MTLSHTDTNWYCYGCQLHILSDSYFSSRSNYDDNEFERFQTKGLHFLHINTHSLLPKLDELRHIAIKSKASVIGITETWLDDSVTDSEVEIHGYSLQRRDRNRNGGGVGLCVYINSNISYNPRHDMGTDFESVWIELFLPKTKPILVGVCYRPPTNTIFYELLEHACNNCSHFYQNECILFDDFNTYYKAINSTIPICQNLKQFLSMFDLQQLIGEPTRVTDTSATIIGLVLVS